MIFTCACGIIRSKHKSEEEIWYVYAWWIQILQFWWRCSVCFYNKKWSNFQQSCNYEIELSKIDKLVKEETGMPVKIAENPLDCVAVGTGKSVEDQEIFEKVLMMNNRK